MQIKEYIISKYGVSVITRNIINRINIDHINGYLFFKLLELIINNFGNQKYTNDFLSELMNLTSIDFS